MVIPNIFLWLCLTTLSISSYVRLQRDDFRQLCFPARLFNTGTELWIYLTFESENQISVATRSLLLGSGSSNVSIVHGNISNELVVPMSIVADSRPVVLRNQWIWGIRPSSRLIHQLGPITILQNNSDPTMLIHSSQNIFQAHCVENSILNLTSPPDLSQVSLSLIGSDGYEPTLITGRFTLALTLLDSPSDDIMVVPSPVYNAVVIQLMYSGAFRTLGSSKSFSACTEERVLDHLPSIVLHFRNGDQFHIQPNDYIHFNNRYRSCYLALSHSERSSENFSENSPVRIDLFKLRNLHIHINHFGVSLCDAL